MEAINWLIDNKEMACPFCNTVFSYKNKEVAITYTLDYKILSINCPKCECDIILDQVKEEQ